MVKKRVYELAKELKIEYKELMHKLTSMGIVVKSHMSTIDEQDIARLIKEINLIKEKEKSLKLSAETAPTSSKFEPRDYRAGRVDRVPARPPDKRFQEKPLPEKRTPARPVQEEKMSPAGIGARPVFQKVRPAMKSPKGIAPVPQKTGTAEAAFSRDLPLGPATETKEKKTSILKAEQLKVPKVPEEVKTTEKGKQIRKPRKGEHQKQYIFETEKEEKILDYKQRYPAAGQIKELRKESQRPHPQKQFEVAEKKPIIISREGITVQEMAEKMKKSPAELIKKLLLLGVMATINQEIDLETATILASEFGFEVKIKKEVDLESLIMSETNDSPSSLQPRPCVVTVMGHVDHGKTSLLDVIRQTNVTATEAGGITQHIGAYQVEHNHKKITFIDTPGHEAFTAMRARGAKITDIAVLVVAAEDGVMPQTIEAINHAKAAAVPIIVAVNKMDKPNANPERIKQQLTEHGLVAEEWGGDTICVLVSAKAKQGIEELLDTVLLVAEMNELKANYDCSARGIIVESELSKERGPVATVLVQNGTLKVGDSIIAGTAFGRVRAMVDHKGKRVKKAGPSTPVEIWGCSEVPQAGDIFYGVPDEKMARQITEKRLVRLREEELKAVQPRISLNDLFKQIKEGQVKELHLIIKADTQGAVEALRQSLEQLVSAEVRVKIIHSGVGAITETDIMLASASNAIIIGFNVRPDVNAKNTACREKVDIRLYQVIYEAINDVKAAMSGLLEPEYVEVSLGRLQVRKVFKASKIGAIAGCYVSEGKVVRDANVRVVRQDKVIYEGKIESLKRFKDDVREVLENYECGLTLEKFNDTQEGDIIEVYTTEQTKRELA